MGRALLHWGPVVGWMLVIFAASSRPKLPYQDDVPDWFSHILIYLVLSVLVSLASSGGGPLDLRPAAWVFASCVVYGISDEWHQSFVPGRHADPWDVLKDGMGAAAGAALYGAWSRRPAAAEAPSS